MKADEFLRSVFPTGRPKAVSKALLAGRSRLDRQRTLPDLLIVGGQRCGTSSLYKYLGSHPLVVPSLRKEVSFFSRHYGKGEAWYRAHFASWWHRSWVRHRHGCDPITFEATPAYLFHPLAASRAASLVPEARILAVLRNPVERAHSHYNHCVRRGWEPLSFEDALSAEQERLMGVAERLATHPDSYSNEYLRYSYMARGFYAEQLERWMALFPRDRLLVLKSEDLFHDPVSTYHRVLEFLGLPPSTPPRLPNYSYRGALKPTQAEMSPALRTRLITTFAPHNQKLEQLVGESFGWDS